MAIQTVNIGTTPNDGTGDPARTAFTKLNDNFTQTENAASKLVATNAEALAGTADVLPDAAGVHAAFNQFGLGAVNASSVSVIDEKAAGFYAASIGVQDNPLDYSSIIYAPYIQAGRYNVLFLGNLTNRIIHRRVRDGITIDVELIHTGNTTIDANGFVKAASPVASLYSDRAESNGAAELEAMQFERIGTGHYRLTGVPELSRDGWYIETPKDRNGNVYFTLDYVESDGTLDIYTYTPDYSTGRAENGAPVDILEGRFVSLRFAEIESTGE